MTQGRWLAGFAGVAVACVPTVPEAEVVELAECADGADVDDTIRIAEEFESSAHEMIQCGSLTFQLIGAVIATAEQWSGSPAQVPSAFSFDQGVFTTTGDGVRMDLALQYGPGSPGGAAGALVEADPTDPDAILVGASAERDGDTTTVTYTEPGPLVELLGLGEAPPNPLVLTADDVARFAENLGTLEVAVTIEVDDPVDASVVTYTIAEPPVALALMILESRLHMGADAGAAVREDLGQQLATTVWDVEFVNGVNQLVGTIEADVSGGPFPFHAKYTYDGLSTYPLTEITCL